MFLARPPSFLRWIYPHVTWRIKTREKRIYLTFDDGPIPEVTPWVLDILKEHNVVATFFCVGENVLKYPYIYNRILQEGHQVGNHTFNHLRGFKTNSEDYLKNAVLAENYVKSGLFRPPHGQIKWSLRHRLTGKYKVIMWDVLSGDYDRKRTAAQCHKKIIKKSRNGSIIVFHDSLKAEKNLREALPKTIRSLKDMGYEFHGIPPK